MIGNCDDAALALTSAHANDFTNILSVWGSSRLVYLINGIVYKVEIDDGRGIANALEFETISNMRDSLPHGVYFPETSLYRVNGDDVIAMTYIQGQAMANCNCTDLEECDESCLPDNLNHILRGLGIDIVGFNVIVNDEGVWVVDP